MVIDSVFMCNKLLVMSIQKRVGRRIFASTGILSNGL